MTEQNNTQEEISDLSRKQLEERVKELEETVEILSSRVQNINRSLDSIEKEQERTDRRFNQVEQDFNNFEKKLSSLDNNFEISDHIDDLSMAELMLLKGGPKDSPVKNTANTRRAYNILNNWYKYSEKGKETEFVSITSIRDKLEEVQHQQTAERVADKIVELSDGKFQKSKDYKSSNSKKIYLRNDEFVFTKADLFELEN